SSVSVLLPLSTFFRSWLANPTVDRQVQGPFRAFYGQSRIRWEILRWHFGSNRSVRRFPGGDFDRNNTLSQKIRLQTGAYTIATVHEKTPTHWFCRAYLWSIFHCGCRPRVSCDTT